MTDLVEHLRHQRAEMKKILVYTFVLCLQCTVSSFGQTWSTLPADLLVDMKTSSPGTAVTASIMTAGTVSVNCTPGTICTWAAPTTNAFSVGSGLPACGNLGPVQMNGTGGTLYPAQALNFNSIAYNDSVPGPGSNEIMTFSGSAASATAVSALVCLTIGPPAQPLSGSDYDRLIFFNTAGYYAVLQFNNENGYYTGGTTTYFHNIMVNWTSTPNLMFWTGGAAVQPPTNLKATVQ